MLNADAALHSDNLKIRFKEAIWYLGFTVVTFATRMAMEKSSITVLPIK